MAPVARELSSRCGILEPLQTAASLPGQIDELSTTLREVGHPPVTLIGFSWGAWLSFMLSANYPQLVERLILVSGGPFEDRFATAIQETRLNRLSSADRIAVSSALEVLSDPAGKERNAAFARLGTLLSKADAHDPVETEGEVIDYRVDIFESVWRDAAELRKSGKLLELGTHIRCPVIAIHGSYDPHPAQGVMEPLSAVLEDLRFIPLERCGHKPWIERRARDEFYAILEELLP